MLPSTSPVQHISPIEFHPGGSHHTPKIGEPLGYHPKEPKASLSVNTGIGAPATSRMHAWTRMHSGCNLGVLCVCTAPYCRTGLLRHGRVRKDADNKKGYVPLSWKEAHTTLSLIHI